MNVPSASLIVPCRNEKDSIELCVRSLLAQELPGGNFEIIVADGLSNDGTRKILARLAAEHACLRCGYEAHADHNAARNLATRGVVSRPNLVASGVGQLAFAW